jgi:hypothetical protein
MQPEGDQMKKYLLTGALALAAFPLSLSAVAQTSKPAAPAQFISQQPSGEWLAHTFFGTVVQNPAGEVIGDINDLVFSRTGQISTVILGIGGVLGMGEKSVGVPFGALSFKAAPDGTRIVVVALSKEQLNAAAPFVASDKTTYDLMKDKAIALSKKASEKAGELKDQAAKKIESMKTETPKKL